MPVFWYNNHYKFYMEYSCFFVLFAKTNIVFKATLLI